MLADKGYDADAIREELLLHGARPVIPSRSTRKRPLPWDYVAYKDRNRIERMFNKLKQFRRIATRYDKTRMRLLASWRWPQPNSGCPSLAHRLRPLFLRSPERKPRVWRFLVNRNLHMSPKLLAET
ncbi:hypothetical protein GGD46_004008 [Rhizobium lusitanum]|uniref:Transposase DDE domain-containing protein n=1 Tax=Rhizobium lusitanum TaxID=293958 RepID=A0A7X0IT73_9HYPH|nr:hypothetical protein [Rhizobium lusitanum]